MKTRIALLVLLMVAFAQTAHAQASPYNRSIPNAGLRSDGELVQITVEMKIRVVDDTDDELILDTDILVQVEGEPVQTHVVLATRPTGAGTCTGSCPGPCPDMGHGSEGSCFDCGCDYIIVASSSHPVEPGDRVEISLIAARGALPETETSDDRITLVYDPVPDAEIWGVKTKDPFSEPPSTLFHLRADGTGFTEVGIILLDGVRVEVDGLAVDAQGRLFGYIAGSASGQLISINPVTAVATAVGTPLSGREIRGAAFDRDGTLVGVDMLGGGLARIDASTGLPLSPDTPLTLNGSAFTPATGNDLVISAAGRAMLVSIAVYDLDLATGVLTERFEDLVPGSDGIAPYGAGLALPENPNDDWLVLYDVNGDDDIYRYDLTPPYTRALMLSHVVPAYNAGRGDLASYVMEPAVGVSPPTRLDLGLTSRPNPFNPRTEIAFTLTRSGHVRLAVYDVRGQLVEILIDDSMVVGDHELVWDGRDRTGRELSSGIYFLRLETREGIQNHKMALIR